MNTNALFRPQFLTSHELKEAWNTGLTRFEISYYAPTKEAEKKFHEGSFLADAQEDLDNAKLALNWTKGVCKSLGLSVILTRFQEVAKRSQMYLQMPNLAAFVFAKSLKNGYFCGFFKDIP